jgi:AcrR family transcriptional regulator
VPRAPSPEIHAALLAAAGRLFYERGIGTTGVDALASAAGVGKPAVYRHFGSKAGLVVATLAKRDEDRRRTLVQALAQTPPSPVARLTAAVDWQLEWVASKRFRGCGFIRAAAELEAGGTAAAERAYEHKAWYRRQLQQLAEEAGAPDPVQLAMRLALAVEGATTLAFLGDRTEVIEAARQQAYELIQTACGTSPDTANQDRRARGRR